MSEFSKIPEGAETWSPEIEMQKEPTADYLSETQMTKIGPHSAEIRDLLLTQVSEICDESKDQLSNFSREDEEKAAYIEATFRWMKNFDNVSLKFTGEKRSELLEKLYYRRSAEEVIESGFALGCAESAAVFRTLAIGGGIPARLVKTGYKEWLDNPSDDNMLQHVFVEVYVNNRWFIVDPDVKRVYDELGISNEDYAKIEKCHVPMTRGLDFAEVEDVETKERYHLRNFREMKRASVEWKRAWKQRHRRK